MVGACRWAKSHHGSRWMGRIKQGEWWVWSCEPISIPCDYHVTQVPTAGTAEVDMRIIALLLALIAHLLNALSALALSDVLLWRWSWKCRRLVSHTSPFTFRVLLLHDHSTWKGRGWHTRLARDWGQRCILPMHLLQAHAVLCKLSSIDSLKYLQVTISSFATWLAFTDAEQLPRSL